jgi:hypothetical protein
MVAEGAESEGLHPARALAMLSMVVVGAVVSAAIAADVNPVEKALLDYSPESLAAIARDHARRLGYPQRPVDSASGLETSSFP